MKLALLLLILSTTACGPAINEWIDNKADDRIEKSIPPKDIEEAFIPFLEEFKYEASIRNIHLPHMDKLNKVFFTDIDRESKVGGTVIGLCQTYTNHKDELIYSEISITNSYRKKIDSCQFKALMFHELGHCVLLRDHDEQSPKTIMSPTIVWESRCKANWEQLVDNLFLGTEMDYE